MVSCLVTYLVTCKFNNKILYQNFVKSRLMTLKSLICVVTDQNKFADGASYQTFGSFYRKRMSAIGFNYDFWRAKCLGELSHIIVMI